MLATTLVLGNINDNLSSISAGYTDKRTVKFKGYESEGELTFILTISGKDKAINKILKALNVHKLDEMCDLELIKTSAKPVQTKLEGDKKKQ